MTSDTAARAAPAACVAALLDAPAAWPPDRLPPAPACPAPAAACASTRAACTWCWSTAPGVLGSEGSARDQLGAGQPHEEQGLGDLARPCGRPGRAAAAPCRPQLSGAAASPRRACTRALRLHTAPPLARLVPSRRGTLDALLHHSAKNPWDPQKLLALVRRWGSARRRHPHTLAATAPIGAAAMRLVGVQMWLVGAGGARQRVSCCGCACRHPPRPWGPSLPRLQHRARHALPPLPQRPTPRPKACVSGPPAEWKPVPPAPCPLCLAPAWTSPPAATHPALYQPAALPCSFKRPPTHALAPPALPLPSRLQQHLCGSRPDDEDWRLWHGPHRG